MLNYVRHATIGYLEQATTLMFSKRNEEQKMDQPSIHSAWFSVALEIVSYRQMYKLSEQIIDDGSVSSEVRKAACRVISELRPVIDQPIAPAKKLSRARRKFQALTAVLGR